MAIPRWNVFECIGLVVLALAANIERCWGTTPLSRQPYVQNLGRSSVTIQWRTKQAALQTVEYGFDRKFIFAQTETQASTHHEVTLSNLMPGRTYDYRIVENGLDASSGRSYRFTTDLGREDVTFSFFVAGDVGEDEKPRQHLTHAAIRNIFPPPDFGLIPGDNVYPDGSSERYDAQLMGPWSELLSGTPVWSTLGNHDWRTDPTRNFEVEWSLPGNEHYYSFDYANAHVIALDTGKGEFYDEEEQMAWLEKDLSTPRDATWTFAFFHYPLLTCTYKGNQPRMAALAMPLFERYGVDVVFTGHAHTFERLYPIVDGQPVDQDQDPNYLDPAGPIYVVSGAAGKYKPNEPTRFCGPTAAFKDEEILFVQIVVRDHTLHIIAINSLDQRVIDVASITKTRTTSDVSLLPPPRLLFQNVPNPFNPSTMIPFAIDRAGFVRMSVYSATGAWLTHLVRETFPAGEHRVMWHGVDHLGRDLPSGVYLVKMHMNGRAESIKMNLVR